MNPPETDLHVGRYVLEKRMATRQAFLECLYEAARDRRALRPRSLGTVLVSRGHLTNDQLNQILIERSASPDRFKSPARPRASSPGGDAQAEVDLAASAYVRQKKLVRRDQLQESEQLCSEIGAYGLGVSLVEVLRQSGGLTEAQVSAIRSLDLPKLVQEPQWKNQPVPGYEFISKLAEGRYGILWTVEAVFEGRRFCVKLLHPERERDPKAVARLEREAVLLRRLKSPHLLGGMDHGFQRGRHYIVLEHAEGSSLSRALTEHGPFDVPSALRLAGQAAQALSLIHAEGYFHRDIRPENFILAPDGGLILFDLGSAAPFPRSDRTAALTRAALKTAEELDRLPPMGGDLYGLGLLLFALLSGRDPFAEAAAGGVVTGRLESGLPIPDLRALQAPAPVVQVTEKLLARDRTRAFTSADVASDALTSLEKG